MAFVPLPNGLKVAMEFSLDDQQMVNTYHVVAVDPDDLSNMIAVATCFIDFWTAIKPHFHTLTSLLRVVVTDVSVSGGRQYIATAGLPAAGTSSSTTLLPNNVAFVATERTGFTGRSKRGRIFFGGFGVGELSAPNTLSTTVADDITDALLDLLACLAADTNQLVVASYRQGGAPLSTAIAYGINSFDMNTTPDSQRRRLPGRGA